jgi:uncharacterized protein YbcI
MGATMPEPASGGSIALSISNAMVKLMAETTGRGPTQARTTIGRDHVLVLLRDTLTKGERVLAERGFRDDVLYIRRRYQDAMREEATALIEDLVGRRVIGFMSENHLDPDLAAEVFILEPSGDGMPTQLSEADSSTEATGGV